MSLKLSFSWHQILAPLWITAATLFALLVAGCFGWTAVQGRPVCTETTSMSSDIQTMQAIVKLRAKTHALMTKHGDVDFRLRDDAQPHAQQQQIG